MDRTVSHGPGAWRVAKLAGFLRAIGAPRDLVHAAEDAADLIDRCSGDAPRRNAWQGEYLAWNDEARRTA